MLLRKQLEKKNSLTTLPPLISDLLRCVTIQVGKEFLDIVLVDPLKKITNEKDLTLSFENFEDSEK